jgi:HTH-type transcriptional regulator / antitoxin HigA
MEIKPIKTRKDYDKVLAAVEQLMDARRNSPEGDRLDVLVTLIEAYEARHFPLDLPDPVAAIKLVMEQRSLTVKDLVPFIGQPNRVYEILAHKRPLTMAMAWKLHRGLGIPAESLIKQAA